MGAARAGAGARARRTAGQQQRCCRHGRHEGAQDTAASPNRPVIMWISFRFLQWCGRCARPGVPVQRTSGCAAGSRSSTLGLSSLTARCHCGEHAHPCCAHFLEGQGDSRQVWAQVGGENLLVVESDDGDVFGDAQPPRLDRVVGAHRHAVVAAEDRGGRFARRRAGRSCRRSRCSRCRRPGTTRSSSRTTPSPRRARRGTPSGGRSGRGCPGSSLMWPMRVCPASSSTRAARRPPATSSGTTLGSSPALSKQLTSTLGTARALSGTSIAAVPGRRDDEALHALFEELLDRLRLHVRLGIARRNQQEALVDPGALLSAADHIHRERGCDDLGDKTEPAGGLLGQRLGCRVAAIAERESSFVNPLACLLGDHHVGAVVQHEGDSSSADAGRARNVGHGGRPGAGCHRDSFVTNAR